MTPLRLLLVRMGSRDFANFHITPPLGVLYLAGYLRERLDLEIRVIDQRAHNIPTDAVVKEAAQFGANIVGLSLLTPSGHMLPDMTAQVRAALPESLIMIGGPHASAFQEAAMAGNDADIAVLGEGESAVERIIEAYLADKDYSQIPGLIWRSDDGTIVTNPGVIPFIDNLDSLPMPAYDLIDVEAYWKLKSFVLIPNRRYVTLMSSRGCPFQCNYCHQVFGKRFRYHSPARVVEEIERFVGAYDVNDIEFVDDIFNYDHDRAMEICELIRERDIKVRFAFPNGFRTDSLSEELIDALVDAGMYYASFALESGSPRIQKEMGKNLHIPSFLENLALAADRGVFCNGYAMVGFPNETREEMEQTIRTMCDSKLHTAQFFTVTPFPGTPLYQHVEEHMPEKLKRICYDEGTYGQMNVNLSSVDDETLFALQRKANLRFYFRPSRLVRILRAHPAPMTLRSYLPVFLQRATKGIGWGASDSCSTSAKS